MNKSRRNRAIALLIIINILTLVCLVRSLYYNYLYRQEIATMSSFSATVQAMSDFRAGEYKVLKIIHEGIGCEVTGDIDKGFEIWTWPSSSILEESGKFSAEAYVDSYNRKMRDMRKQSKSLNNI